MTPEHPLRSWNRSQQEAERAEKTQAEKDSQERVDKAAYINEQLAERLPQAGDPTPGVAPAKDARVDYTPRTAVKPKPAADKG